MQDFRKFAIWEKAHQLSLNIYRLARELPRTGNAGLMSQMRRAAEAIPANIAEGTGRGSDAEFAHYLQISIGSSSELESHLQFAVDVELIPRALFEARKAEVIEIRRMLIGFRKKLVRDKEKPPRIRSMNS